MKNQRIGVVGTGAMGEAFVNGLLSSDLSPDQITASCPRKERAQALAESLKIRTTTSNQEAAKDADIVLLTVKPQALEKAAKSIRDVLNPNCLVISIVAGASLERLSSLLGHSRVVRAMPNTPAQIGHGITVWLPSEGLTQEDLERTEKVFQAVGVAVRAQNEDQLDMSTALSGSGPAYVFLFMEAMVDAGVHLGFPRYLSEQLVTQTVKGAVEYYLHQPNHLARLRDAVTSPGGTTAEALYQLEKAGFRTAMSEAIWAAFYRSQELGQGLPRKRS